MSKERLLSAKCPIHGSNCRLFNEILAEQKHNKRHRKKSRQAARKQERDSLKDYI